MSDALVIGGGPAGLMAAEQLLARGRSVILAEAMPTVGRKFLMAGKSGLNLTRSEDAAKFLASYRDTTPAFEAAVSAFGPAAVMQWAEELGQAVFTGSTGRVFPESMKASPLLRTWLARLREQGLDIQTRWRWVGWASNGAAQFETPDGPQDLSCDVTVLALGGGSWRRLGSDGAWADWFGDSVTPFRPSNVGLAVDWTPHMAGHFGAPIKGVSLRAGPSFSRGEFTVSNRGLEGGGIYEVSSAVVDGHFVNLDLFPDHDLDALRAKLAKPRGKASLATFLRKALSLTGGRLALLQEFGRPLPDDLAPLLKSLPIRHSGSRPLDEAISTAGGLRLDAVTDGFMLREKPGVFCAGEMLDWDAPTGGYLITGCLATGRTAGEAAAAYLDSQV